MNALQRLAECRRSNFLETLVELADKERSSKLEDLITLKDIEDEITESIYEIYRGEINIPLIDISFYNGIENYFLIDVFDTNERYISKILARFYGSELVDQYETHCTFQFSLYHAIERYGFSADTFSRLIAEEE